MDLENTDNSLKKTNDHDVLIGAVEGKFQDGTKVAVPVWVYDIKVFGTGPNSYASKILYCDYHGDFNLANLDQVKIIPGVNPKFDQYMEYFNKCKRKDLLKLYKELFKE